MEIRFHYSPILLHSIQNKKPGHFYDRAFQLLTWVYQVSNLLHSLMFECFSSTLKNNFTAGIFVYAQPLFSMSRSH
jgi:hypothetical protein